MVEEIEELRPELQVHTLVGQLEVLDSREIRIHEVRPVDGSGGSRSELSRRWSDIALGVEPLAQGRMAALRIANLVGAVPVGEVVQEVHAGLVGAVVHVDGESRKNSFNHVNRPTSQHGVDWAVPVTTELLALAEGQGIEHAGGELVVEIEPGQAPIGFVGSRQRPVSSSAVAAKTIGHSRIECAGIGITQKHVKPVPGSLGLSFDLKRIIAGRTSVGEVGDIVELVGCRAGKSAAQVVTRVVKQVRGTSERREACLGRPNVHVQAIYQNVGATRSRISGGEHDVAWQLMLDVQVELLNHALLEVEILRLDRPKEVADAWRAREYAADTEREPPADSACLNRGSSGEYRGRTGSWEAKRTQTR